MRRNREVLTLRGYSEYIVLCGFFVEAYLYHPSTRHCCSCTNAIMHNVFTSYMQIARVLTDVILRCTAVAPIPPIWLVELHNFQCKTNSSFLRLVFSLHSYHKMETILGL